MQHAGALVSGVKDPKQYKNFPAYSKTPLPIDVEFIYLYLSWSEHLIHLNYHQVNLLISRRLALSAENTVNVEIFRMCKCLSLCHHFDIGLYVSCSFRILQFWLQ